MAKVSFIGLGVMGYPMAGHLAKKGGHDVTVFNRTAAKAEAWVAQYGGRSASSPAAAAEGADFVFTCVGNDDDLRSVTVSPQGAFARMKRGAIYIDNTTASADIARELDAAAKARGFASLDAPVPADRPVLKTANSPSWLAARSTLSNAPNPSSIHLRKWWD